jgi:hypothetical protein
MNEKISDETVRLSYLAFPYALQKIGKNEVVHGCKVSWKGFIERLRLEGYGGQNKPSLTSLDEEPARVAFCITAAKAAPGINNFNMSTLLRNGKWRSHAPH